MLIQPPDKNYKVKSNVPSLPETSVAMALIGYNAVEYFWLTDERLLIDLFDHID